MRPEAKAVVAELMFIDGAQYLADGLLDDPVHHRRDTKRAGLALILRDFYPTDGIRALRDFYPTDGIRAVSARFQGFHEFIFVFFQIVSQFLG